ncbi:MAG: hypothetical protein HY694_18030 [Deltaproteobacteria bacterium]|nr:hypothetical protein [Deltaproteobacteria bacterium]
MRKYRRLWDTYGFPGFRPSSAVQGIFGDPKARVICLHRRGKKLPVEPVATSVGELLQIDAIPCGRTRPICRAVNKLIERDCSVGADCRAEVLLDRREGLEERLGVGAW